MPCNLERLPASDAFLLGLYFDPENGGQYVPLKHEGFSKIYNVPRRKYFSASASCDLKSNINNM
jgi:hypothetical protein